jgi:hypothetical protein
MAEMVCSNLAAPAHAPAADVLVTVDIATLAEAFADAGSAPEPSQDPTPAKGPVPGRGARLDDGPALAAACLRRLVDDGRLRFATADSDGNLLDLGRASRIPNAAQFRALWRRDHGCSVPGCGRTRFLHAHHVVFWSNGGATTLDNLVLLCSEHHRALHEGAFTITALGRQRFRFTGADGTECQPAPTVHGTADDLVTEHADITPDAIHPNWDGTPLHRDAIGTYLDAWKAVLRRNRAAA